MNTLQNLAITAKLEKLAPVGNRLVAALKTYFNEEKFSKSLVVKSETASSFVVSLHGTEILVRAEYYIGLDSGAVAAYLRDASKTALTAAVFDELGNVRLNTEAPGLAVTVDEAPPEFLFRIFHGLQKHKTPLADTL